MGYVFGITVQADGGTPLFMACQTGHADAVRALLGAGAVVDHKLVCLFLVVVARVTFCFQFVFEP
jgi:ankyrin repeat protein